MRSHGSHALQRLMLERGARHLHTLGPRVLAAFLDDLSVRIGGMPAALGLLAEYERLKPESRRRKRPEPSA